MAPSAEKLSQDGIMMCVGGRDGALGLRLCETPWLRSNSKRDGGANVIDGTMRIDVSPRLVLLLRDLITMVRLASKPSGSYPKMPCINVPHFTSCGRSSVNAPPATQRA